MLIGLLAAARAGLTPAGHGLRRLSPATSGLPRNVRAVLRAYGGEVLNPQPPAVRDILLSTSIVQRVNAEAASELTGDEQAGRILPVLARANAFVQPAGSGWYRTTRCSPKSLDLVAQNQAVLGQLVGDGQHVVAQAKLLAGPARGIGAAAGAPSSGLGGRRGGGVLAGRRRSLGGRRGWREPRGEDVRHHDRHDDHRRHFHAV